MPELITSQKRMSRRTFVFGSVAALGLGSTGYLYARTPIRLALIGAGKQGSYLAETINKTWWFASYCGDIRAVCDVDHEHAHSARNNFCKNAELYQDYRKVLERDDIEAVVIATPDHWHAKIAIDALRSGKAVYCEKPISLTIEEGRRIVEAVQETGQVFLGGTMQRTYSCFRTAVELARNGRLGKLQRIVISLPQRWQGESQGPFPAQTPPASLDWNTWLGQAPWADYCPQRCHGYFRRWFEYAGGQMTDWGAHHMDIAHWAMGMDHGGPSAVSAYGALPQIANGFNTPIDFTVDMDYPDGVHLEVKTDADPAKNGLRMEGDGGWLWVSRLQLEGSAVEELRHRPLPPDAIRMHPAAPAAHSRQVYHMLHFFRCVRREELPVSDVVSQHRSASACHLANISLRLGRKITWDAATEQVIDDPQAQAMLSRPRRSGFAL